MAIKGSRITVNTSATRLDTADTDTVAGKSVVVTNKGASVIDLGPSGVTTGTGYQLAVDASASVDLGGGESLYGITASGTAIVHVLESGV